MQASVDLGGESGIGSLLGVRKIFVKMPFMADGSSGYSRNQKQKAGVDVKNIDERLVEEALGVE